MAATSATRRATSARTPHSAFGGTLVGIFIGIVVGLGMAATVAYWLMKNNPALPMPSLSHDTREAPQDVTAKVAKADADKPRFDFYKILPGIEEPKVDPARRALPLRLRRDEVVPLGEILIATSRSSSWSRAR